MIPCLDKRRVSQPNESPVTNYKLPAMEETRFLEGEERAGVARGLLLEVETERESGRKTQTCWSLADVSRVIWLYCLSRAHKNNKIIIKIIDLLIQFI